MARFKSGRKDKQQSRTAASSRVGTSSRIPSEGSLAGGRSRKQVLKDDPHMAQGASAGRAPQNNGGDGTVFRFENYRGIRAVFNPLWCYNGFRATVILLTCFGLMMVFSSSAIRNMSLDLSPWKSAVSQGVYCILGLISGLVAVHIPERIYRRFSALFLGFAIFLQTLVITRLGVSVQGHTGWIGIRGVFTMQPAEVIKLALCLFLPRALIRAHKLYAKEGIKAYLVPALLLTLSLGAIMLGRDLGTAMIVVLIGAIAFLIGGFPSKWLAVIFASLAALVLFFVVTSPNRVDRILATYKTCSSNNQDSICYQALHAKYAMASGGLFGVGIGNSREKWNYLPEAHNDFIFAIIGEEMGFIGAAAVIILFAIMGWCLVCVAVQTSNRYVSMVLVCIAVWIVGQALINIMVVVGLLPVMGVPLPFVSAGGSSLIMCLVAAGVAVSLMKEQPEIRAGSSTSHV